MRVLRTCIASCLVLAACDRSEPAPTASANAPAAQGAANAPTFAPPSETEAKPDVDSKKEPEPEVVPDTPKPILPKSWSELPEVLAQHPLLVEDGSLEAWYLAPESAARTDCGGGWRRVELVAPFAGHMLGRGNWWQLFVVDSRSELWGGRLERSEEARNGLRDALAEWKKECTPHIVDRKLMRLSCGTIQIRKVEVRHYEVGCAVPTDLDVMALPIDSDDLLAHPEFADVDTALVIGRDADFRSWLTDVQFAKGPVPGPDVCVDAADPSKGIPTLDTKHLPPP